VRRARPIALVAIALLAALLAAPTGVLAAGPVTVTGTVVRDGLPVTGASVTVSVVGGDLVASATTDETGAFTADIEALAGDQVSVSAKGQTFQSEPDARGCVHFETPTGSLAATLDTLPPGPLEVTLDQLVTSTVCGTTATPRVTPPATDAIAAPRPGSASRGGLLLALGVLALAGTASLLVASRRR